MPYQFPTSYRLQEIGPAKLAALSATRLGMQLMPMRAENTAEVRWMQRDNYRGLQQLRGLGGGAPLVGRHGDKTYSYEPGYFGEHGVVFEAELTKRAGSTVGEATIDLTDLVFEWQDRLVQREVNRMESLIWTLLTEGKIAVANLTGVTFAAQFTLQTVDVSDWSNASASTPLQDLQKASLLARGNGVNFGSAARVYINQTRANQLVLGRNSAELGFVRAGGGNTVTTLAEINAYLGANNLPSFQVYDEGYFDESNNFKLFIPDVSSDGEYDIYGVLVGSRTDGSPLGEYVITRNAIAGGPSSYDLVKNFTGLGPDGEPHVPPRLEVHRGHNGGPVIYFPSAICILRRKK